MPKEMRMDFSMLLNKPFLAGVFTWNNAQLPGAEIGSIPFPASALTGIAIDPFKLSSLFRLRARAILQVAGTPQHSGLLLANVTPYSDLYPQTSMNQRLQSPHVFLAPNESTPCAVEIPFYKGEKLLSSRALFTDEVVSFSAVNYAKIAITVINRMGVPTGGSTSLSVSVHVIFEESEFYVPNDVQTAWIAQSSSEIMKIPSKLFDGVANGVKTITNDFIDSVRQGVRSVTGFHNPNNSTIGERVITTDYNFVNNVDQPNFFEKLDQHAQFDRITQEPIFHTTVDEMSMKYLLSKPAYDGSFFVNTADLEGRLLYSAPISPMVETRNQTAFDTQTNRYFSSNLRIFYELSRYWRGSLKMHIQASMSNFQYLKLLVVKVYGASPANGYNHIPPFYSVLNLPTSAIEFSGGGQTQTVDLPFCSPLDQIECTKDLWANAGQHGMVYIYLLQPLVSTGSGPDFAEFNVYFSAGDDFCYYGYATDPFEVLNIDPALFKAESASVLLAPSDQQGVLNDVQDALVDHRAIDFKPMYSVRDYVRRVQPSYVRSMPVNFTTQFFNLADIVDSPNSLGVLRHLFYGFNGGFKIQVTVRGVAGGGMMRYIPPCSFYRLTENNHIISRVPDDPAFNALFIMDSNAQATLPYQLRSGADNYNEQTFEFTIPNYSPFSFISTQNADRYTSSMGSLVYSRLDTTLLSDNAEFCFHVGLTDESRYGFQVKAPKVRAMQTVILTFPSRLTVAGSSNVVISTSTETFNSYYYSRLS